MDYTTFAGKYRLEEEIANGGCGTVFLGVHTVAGKEVAIKLEPATTPGSTPSSTRNTPLKQESKLYKTLMGGTGIPWIMWSGRQGDYNVMIIDLLGPSLEDLFKRCNRHFSLKTVLLLADQLISRIEFIHTNSIVHRDIKPANFVMGTGKAAHMVNVIDFGLAKRFRDARTSAHIPYKQDDVHGVGTSLFAAINTHLGVESSRRDDLESLAYMLIYFLRGTLPWRKLRAPTTPPPLSLPSSPSLTPSGAAALQNQHQNTYNPVSATWDLIRDAKIAHEPTLTAGLPPEFDVLYRYARGLEFDDLPDYEGLRALFRGLAGRVGVDYDGVFDWSVKGPGEGKEGGGGEEGKAEAEREGKGETHGRGTGAGGRRYCEACNARRR
ncbi:Casein kinase I isoform epsilon [Psilocybe cubensis]|uniref:non-specific serine/threonine protein kinase n=2 Tax=Psilocybe cubensis TaxID=181762 RepID=A0A8H7XMP9_PSICU|nr:Casein kinase I isoform epsilon [Psilocybe cubensis]KAH9475355.1 Casein kinase I isoform epsilon [Psilocybe cubensis]